MDEMSDEFGEMLRVSYLSQQIFLFLSTFLLNELTFILLFTIQFLLLLQETLEKMRERIEISSGNFDGPDLPIQQRMEELKHDG